MTDQDATRLVALIHCYTIKRRHINKFTSRWYTLLKNLVYLFHYFLSCSMGIDNLSYYSQDWLYGQVCGHYIGRVYILLTWLLIVQWWWFSLMIIYNIYYIKLARISNGQGGIRFRLLFYTSLVVALLFNRATIWFVQE